MNSAALVGERPRWGAAPSRFCAPEGAARPGRRLLDADSWATPALQGSSLARGPGVGMGWRSHGVLPTDPQGGADPGNTAGASGWTLRGRQHVGGAYRTGRQMLTPGRGQEAFAVEWEHPGGGRALPSQGRGWKAALTGGGWGAREAVETGGWGQILKGPERQANCPGFQPQLGFSQLQERVHLSICSFMKFLPYLWAMLALALRGSAETADRSLPGCAECRWEKAGIARTRK